jgi:hypothetical protein
LEWITPLNKNIAKIQAHYDKSIEGYFVFFKYLVGMSVLVAIMYSVLLSRHLINLKYSYSELCPGMFKMPCFLYYSRFDSGSDTYYSLTLILFALLCSVLTINKWISFDIERKRKELYEDKKKKFSKHFFNLWDWSSGTSSFEGKQRISSVRLEIKMNLDEERIR